MLLCRSGSGTSFGTSWNEGLTFSFFADLGISEGPGYDLYDAMSLLPDGSIAVVAAHFTRDRTSVDIDYRNLVDQCLSSDRTSPAAFPKVPAGYSCPYFPLQKTSNTAPWMFG